MSDLESAYFAGFFDGEGYVGITKTIQKSKPKASITYQMLVMIGQVVPEPLFKLQLLYKGYLQKKILKSGKQFTNWTLSGDNAAKFLLAIRPFTVIKSNQIDIALEFQSRMKPARTGWWGKLTEDELLYREDAFRKIKSMKK